MSSGIEYRVIAEYQAQTERCIKCDVDQIIFVKTPFVFDFQGTERNPTGWLYGRNLQTDSTGYVPAEFVEYRRTVTVTVNRPFSSTPLPVIRETAGSLEELPIQPSTTTRSEYTPMPGQRLEDQKWYWGNVSKEEVKERLENQQDGTYLVRDSTNGGYTLTLRKEQSNKLIKIQSKDGMFGFSAPFEFTSVVALIQKHQRESLVQFNPELNIRLLYPLSKEDDGERLEQLESLKQIVDQYVAVSQDHERDLEKSNSTKKEAKRYRTEVIPSYEETMSLFKEQVQTIEHAIESVKGKGTEDENKLTDNYRQMKERLKEISNYRSRDEQKLDSLIRQSRKIDQNLEKYKAEINRMKAIRDSKITLLREMNIPEDEINSYLKSVDNEDDNDVYHRLDIIDLPSRYPVHNDQQTWYFPKFGRTDAENQLFNQEDGTFLIRDRKDKVGPPHACSLVVRSNGKPIVHHCLITRTEDGFGFAEPFNLHQTLKDLVLHYAHNSLLPHNEMLDTTLKYPLLGGRTTRRSPYS